MPKPPPKYRYPFYKKWDKDCYKLIVKLTNSKQIPEILGDKEGINRFLRILIQSQKMHDWRKFLKIVLKSISSKQINVSKILKQEFKIPKGYEKWVVYREHIEITDFLDALGRKQIQFIGNKREITEFILRFILAQLLLDWKSSIYAVKEVIGKKSTVKLKSLNNVLSEFDYTNIFKK